MNNIKFTFFSSMNDFYDRFVDPINSFEAKQQLTDFNYVIKVTQNYLRLSCTRCRLF